MSNETVAYLPDHSHCHVCFRVMKREKRANDEWYDVCQQGDHYRQYRVTNRVIEEAG